MFEEFNHFFQENKKDKRINDKGEMVPDKCDKCGSKIAVFLHGEPIYQCTKCKKYFGTVPCNINESYMTHEWLMKQKFPDPDSTSGTSDFDVTDNDEPDDCFYESVRTNGVFLKGGMITKESNIPFKKLYHGTHAPLKTHDGYAIVDGPFFVTPYKSLASIFAVRKNTNESLPSEVPKKMITNISYEEWGSPSDTILNKVHELVMYADDTHFDDIVSMEKGYVYEFDVDDEIRDHIFQSDAMKRGGNREYVIDKLPQLRIISETPIDVELTLRPIKDHNQDRVKRTLMRYGMVQEAYDAITGEEIPIDHAYTMDEMKERTYTDDDLDKIRSKEELEAFYTKLKSELGQGETIQEAKLPAKKRKELPDSDFALVYTDNRTGKKVRKYPVHDKEHVESAARMFPRGVPLKYQGEVARKILRRAHEFGIDTSGWKNLNRFKESD